MFRLRDNQHRFGSAIETVIQVGVGFILALALQYFVIQPVYGQQGGFHGSLEITLMFTVLALIRHYAIRRWFTR